MGNIVIGMLILLAGSIGSWQINRLTSLADVFSVAAERATTARQVHQNSTVLIAVISRLLPVREDL